jgi:amino acid adenylation domain-containing protein
MAGDFDPFAGPQILSTVPTTEPQREVWTSSQISTDANLAYNESVSVRLKGTLDAAALERAVQQLVARHEVLRSSFTADGLTMLVHDTAELKLEPLDFERTPENLEALKARVVNEPFVLEKAPLARAHLVKLAAQEHVLVFTAHHIICDGWSTAVLMGDLARLYSGEALTAPASFTKWGRDMESRRASTDARADEQYWVSRFAGEAPVLELPTDRPRPPLKTYTSLREDKWLDEALIRTLKKAGAKERASLFAVLLAGFKALLFKLSGQEDLVVGIPSAGQSIGGYDGLVGHCVNMLPLRTRVSADASLRSFLGEVRGTLLDGTAHQLFTMGSLLAKLPIARDASRLPLVSVIFNVDRGMSPESMPFKGLSAELDANPRRYETYDIFLNAVELSGKVKLECQYNTDLFDAATVRRWLSAYERLLGSMAELLESGQGAVGDLQAASPQELAQLDAWNEASALEVDPKRTVVDLIEEQVGKTPEAVAVECEGRSLTYRALEARANAIAEKLRSLGVGPGALVGLCVERSVDLVAGLFGVLKAGAGYVPLDPAYPSERLSFMVQDAQMKVLLTQASVAKELKLPAPHTVCVEDIAAEAPREPSAARPENVCYVIFTSGSTGKPKGVLVPHRAVANLLKSVQRTPGLEPDDTVLAVTTLSFDIAVSEVILPLTVGARIVLATREVASDGARLLTLLKESKATFLDATPATYRLLLGAGWNGDGLKSCICTGEAMPKDVALELVKRVPSVWNGYGPTETTVWSTFYEVKAPVGRILIGKPVANTQCYVLDAKLKRVLPGVVGELFIGGRGVSLGYLNRNELTKERFIANPFGEGVLYKTGDLVRHLADGNMECLGRNDFQVKLRGFRIELGEVEDAMTQHPSVRQAAAVVREVKPGDPRLLGYLVTHPGKTVSDSELRAHLKKTLPDYMVPQNLVRLERMPLSPAGKIDRKALPALELDKAQVSDDFVAPRSDTEKLLAKLWSEVLGVGRVGATDDFFALGGHSLLASQLLARLRKEHGVDLSFRKIFEAPTLEKLAALFDGAGRDGPKPIPVTMLPKWTQPGPVPLSMHQERLWLLEEMDPAQKLVHSLPAAWRFKGLLDVELLQRSFDLLAKRQASLRTAIRILGGKPMQVVLSDRTLPLERVDLSSLTPVQQDAETERQLDLMMAKEFDLASDVLVRSILLKYAADDHALITTRHNIIWDGWSFDLFLKESAEIYGALKAGKASPLPELPVSYVDFSQWHREWLKGPEIAKQVEFWQGKLAGNPNPLEIPTDRARTGTRGHAGANEGINLSREQGDALNAFALSHKATTFMVLFSAYVTLLHRYTSQTDVVIGTPVRARTRTELEDIIGAFTNAVLLRVKLKPEWTFLELVEHVRELTLDGFGNQDMPMELLGQQAPMVRALFSLQEARTRPLKFGDVDVSQFHAKPPSAANELMLWTMETRASLLMMLNYSTDLFDAATAKRFLEQLKTICTEVLKDPRRPLAHFPILPEQERQRLASFSMGTGTAAVPEGRAATPHEWLELLEDGERPERAVVKGVPSRALKEALLKASKEAWSVYAPLGAPVAVHKLTAGPGRIAGTVLPTVQARVVDAYGEIVPIGVWGELEVDRERTRQRVRWRDDGTLELGGRTDGKAEIDGAVADLKEMAKSLEQHPAVVKAAVVVADDANGRPSAVVFFTTRRGVAFTETELRKRVRAVAPDEFVPRRLVELEEMPVTEAGAVDFDRLPAPFPKGANEVVAPRSEAEKRVAKEWLKVLRLSQLSVYDNFFDSGGHSLLALQVIEKLFQETGLRVSPRIMLLGTLEQVAAALEAAPASKSAVTE